MGVRVLPKPTALGTAVPGLVEKGRVTISDALPRLGGRRGIQHGGAPQSLVDDVRGALAQETVGLPRSSSEPVIVCGTAVGSAYSCGGTVLRGSRGWAGEVNAPVRPSASP